MIPDRAALRRFFTRIFTVIGMLVVGSFATLLLIGTLYGPRTPTVPARAVLTLDFSAPITEMPGQDPFGSLLGQQPLPLRSLIYAIDRAGKDDRVHGLVADVSDVTLGPAQIGEVRAAIARFRATGKFAYAYADSFGDMGPGNRPYWLASAFERIWLQPLGGLGLTGGSMSLPFARATLDRIGIVPDFRQRYEYKGAVDNLTEQRMPEPVRRNYRQLLDDMHTAMLQDISTDRGIALPALRTLVNRAPLLGEDAHKAGLITDIDYPDAVLSLAKTQAGLQGDTIDLGSYMAALPPPAGAPQAQVALIHVDGMILRHGDDRDPFGGGDVAGADDIVQAIAQAAKDRDTKAIILRVSSPGGSVTASESIHHAIVQARAAGKYVVVSMGELAASGGYWIATAADRIIADPCTITGSIGVVGGKVVIGPLSEKLGISWEELGTGTNSTMFSPVRPFSASAAATVNASLDSVYQAFVTRVAQGRNLKPDQIDALARGRVWSGQRAQELGLVDELGGLREAFMAVRTHLGLAEDAVLSVQLLPAPESPTELVLKLLGQMVNAPALGISGWHQMQAALARLLEGGVISPTGSLVYTGPVHWQ